MVAVPTQKDILTPPGGDVDTRSVVEDILVETLNGKNLGDKNFWMKSALYRVTEAIVERAIDQSRMTVTADELQAWRTALEKYIKDDHVDLGSVAINELTKAFIKAFQNHPVIREIAEVEIAR